MSIYSSGPRRSTSSSSSRKDNQAFDQKIAVGSLLVGLASCVIAVMALGSESLGIGVGLGVFFAGILLIGGVAVNVAFNIRNKMSLTGPGPGCLVTAVGYIVLAVSAIIGYWNR